MDLNSPGSTRPVTLRLWLDLDRRRFCGDAACRTAQAMASVTGDSVELRDQPASGGQPARVTNLTRDGWDYFDSVSSTASTPAVTTVGNCAPVGGGR